MAVKWFNQVFKICPKFQILISGFSYFVVNDLHIEHWAKNVQRENISFPIYVLNTIYWSKVYGQEFLCILSDLNIPLEQHPEGWELKKII